jgi:hypothetical protein
MLGRPIDDADCLRELAEHARPQRRRRRLIDGDERNIRDLHRTAGAIELCDGDAEGVRRALSAYADPLHRSIRNSLAHAFGGALAQITKGELACVLMRWQPGRPRRGKLTNSGVVAELLALARRSRAQGSCEAA